MTGRALYDKHSRALKAAERYRWNGSEYQRVFPDRVPVTWDFLSDDLKKYYTELARLLTPRVKR